MSVTVYTQPDCVQCNQTKKVLDRQGIGYTTIEITDELREKFLGLGLRSAPVVHNSANDDWWCGFRDDKLRGLHQSLTGKA